MLVGQMSAQKVLVAELFLAQVAVGVHVKYLRRGRAVGRCGHCVCVGQHGMLWRCVKLVAGQSVEMRPLTICTIQLLGSLCNVKNFLISLHSILFYLH